MNSLQCQYNTTVCNSWEKTKVILHEHNDQCIQRIGDRKRKFYY